MAIHREAHIHHCNENGEDVAHVGSLAVVLLGDFQSWCWHHFLPSQAHVCAEDDDSHDIEKTPTQRLEDFELHSVDVTNSHSLAAGIIHPKEVQAQLEEGLQVQQVRRWAQGPWLSSTESELIQMDHHEGEQGDPGNCQVHLSGIQSIVHTDIPCPLNGPSRTCCPSACRECSAASPEQGPRGKGLVSLREEPRVAYEGRGQDPRLVGCPFLHGPGLSEGDPFHHCTAEECGLHQ
mmetsp:Transcript_12044/g.14587  ORF Transcript_12044/g.14587 Transcript_12044/m.14587 type:complete len:235 (-) Transcript_12044:99-803(-)